MFCNKVDWKRAQISNSQKWEGNLHFGSKKLNSTIGRYIIIQSTFCEKLDTFDIDKTNSGIRFSNGIRTPIEVIHYILSPHFDGAISMQWHVKVVRYISKRKQTVYVQSRRALNTWVRQHDRTKIENEYKNKIRTVW